MRTSLVIYMPSLAMGGAERMKLHIARELAQKEYDITFLVHRTEGTLAAEIPAGVRLACLNCSRTLRAFWPLVRFLRKEKPDILLCGLGHNNVVALWAARIARVNTRVIVGQHNALSAERMHGWKYRILPLLYRCSLFLADGIIAVSRGVAEDMARLTGISPTRIRVIYNPVITADFETRMEAHAAHPWLADGGGALIVGIGRFVEQKDFSALLTAVTLVAQTHDVRLILLGDGPLRPALESQARALGIASRVSMPGFEHNPLPFLRHAAMLVLSSRHEGFGNVLVEALGCGTQAVSTDCPFGPAEILDNGRFGNLVPVRNPGALATAIAQTLACPRPPEMLRARAREFTAAKATECYLNLFRETLGARVS